LGSSIAVEQSTHSLFGFKDPVRIYARDTLGQDAKIRGPALITETVATTLVNPGWDVRLDRIGNLILSKNHSEL
jgi:N-methylhydantoinase A/oxoprolinase/acetone carboxylase beta subunit